jgi:serine/threonine protein kinase
MQSMIGRQLGYYEVLSWLGAGAMGEVYRARDRKLGRDVALKILPPDVAGDSDRLARFEREARVLASLNHPRIAAIYGFEEADGVRAIVLELVEGPTLSDRLSRGAVPVDEAIAIARQLADALEAAHEKAIVHRDLKPANIKLTPDGAVKVLDFGIAKAIDPSLGSDASKSPTAVTAGTGAGVILGTAGYMSPEQARGQAVDKRTDIWAFGCVLYEMLTGQRAFPGETMSDVVAEILHHEPDWSLLPARAAPGIQRLLRRCLEKDAKRRLRDIGDARTELDEATAGPSVVAVMPTIPRWRQRAARAAPWLAIGAALAFAVLALIDFGKATEPSSVDSRVTRLTSSRPRGVPGDFTRRPVRGVHGGWGR